MNRHPAELLSAYADDELTVAETERVAAHLAVCTECARELALIRSMGEAMTHNMNDQRGASVWHSVNRRIATPVGWLLISAGFAVWIVMALLQWFSERSLTWTWLASTAVGIGLALLAVGVFYEQYHEARHSPYKDLER